LGWYFEQDLLLIDPGSMSLATWNSLFKLKPKKHGCSPSTMATSTCVSKRYVVKLHEGNLSWDKGLPSGPACPPSRKVRVFSHQGRCYSLWPAARCPYVLSNRLRSSEGVPYQHVDLLRQQVLPFRQTTEVLDNDSDSRAITWFASDTNYNEMPTIR
jgi:hypothetical protein